MAIEAELMIDRVVPCRVLLTTARAAVADPLMARVVPTMVAAMTLDPTVQEPPIRAEFDSVSEVPCRLLLTTARADDTVPEAVRLPARTAEPLRPR